MTPNNKIRVEFTRKTILSEGRGDALRAKMTFYKALAAELGETEDLITALLVDYSNICVQAVKAEGIELAQVQDTPVEIEAKFRVYLELNPKYVRDWKREIESLN